MSSTPHNRAYFHAHTTSHIWICSRFQTNSFLSSPINAIVVKVVVIRGQRWIIVWLSQNHKVATCPEFQNWFLSASRFPNSHYKWSVQRDAVNRRQVTEKSQRKWKGEMWKLSSNTWKLSQAALASLSWRVSVADTQYTVSRFSHRRARTTVCQLMVVAQSVSQSTKLMPAKEEWNEWLNHEYERYERKFLTNRSEMWGGSQSFSASRCVSSLATDMLRNKRWFAYDGCASPYVYMSVCALSSWEAKLHKHHQQVVMH